MKIRTFLVTPLLLSEYQQLYPITSFGRLRSVQRLCQMRGLDIFTSREIRNRVRSL